MLYEVITIYRFSNTWLSVFPARLFFIKSGLTDLSSGCVITSYSIHYTKLYDTVADVGMRKSPTIREMVSIRNAMKILSDADVVASKKEASVRTIQEECLSALDLSFTLDSYNFV